MATAVPQADHVHLAVDPGQVCAAYARHRRRFINEVEALDDDSLAAPSRCSAWTVADVIRHCLDVDDWMRAIWTGTDLPFTSFDPRVTPDDFVAAARAIPDTEIQQRYRPSAEAMADEVAAGGPDRWGATSLSPLGFVPWWLSAMHVFWDSCVHERDALLPVGVDVPAEPEELVPALAYVLAVTGTLISEPIDVVVGGVRLTARGDGPVVSAPVADPPTAPELATLVDALSGRGPLEAALPDHDTDDVHRLGTLSRTFLA